MARPLIVDVEITPEAKEQLERLARFAASLNTAADRLFAAAEKVGDSAADIGTVLTAGRREPYDLTGPLQEGEVSRFGVVVYEFGEGAYGKIQYTGGAGSFVGYLTTAMLNELVDAISKVASDMNPRAHLEVD